MDLKKLVAERFAIPLGTLDVVTLKSSGLHPTAAKPRLRFDRVVIRLMDQLRAAADETVPEGTTVLVTVTAPILLPAKTAVALQEEIQIPRTRDWKSTVHGNRVMIRVVRHKSAGTPKLIGFVHNPDSAPLLLLNVTQDLLELPRAKSRDRWLVVRAAVSSACLDVFRYIYSQLRLESGYQKILLVFNDGSTAALTD